MFRYYLTQRPPMPGAFPRPAANVVSFDERKEVPHLTSKVWGYVEYEDQLAPYQLIAYEMREAGPFYVNRETGEMISRQVMLARSRSIYNVDDPANATSLGKYYEEVKQDA